MRPELFRRCESRAAAGAGGGGPILRLGTSEREMDFVKDSCRGQARQRAPAADHLGKITTKPLRGPVSGAAIAVDELQLVLQHDGREDTLDRS